MVHTLKLVQAALLCALMILATLLFKFVLPGTDLLITPQLFFVILCGYLLEPRYCLIAMGLYLILGLCGLPVFSAVCGPAVAATPSFGYLVSFPFSASVTSLCAVHFRQSRLKHFLPALAGLLTSYCIALIYIALLSRVYLHKPLGLEALLTMYCLAFLPVDLLKTFLASAIGTRLKKALRL